LLLEKAYVLLLLTYCLVMANVWITVPLWLLFTLCEGIKYFQFIFLGALKTRANSMVLGSYALVL